MSVTPARPRNTTCRLPVDWDHLTRLVRLWARKEREAGRAVFPQLEWEHYRAEFERRLAEQERRSA